MAEYCLRWNNHQPNLVTVFSELLTSEALVDVTLASDGQAIRAHRLVLSACSAYFKDLFGLNPCAHPIVFLKDIHYEDLKTVIDFIYKGEVNVAQDRLQDVLKTAELLRIKGLADKPFNYDEYSSQTREPRLSSSFSSQRSSLTDSRDHVVSTEVDDAAEAPSSPRPAKRRKIASQDSSESQQDSGHDSEDRTKAVDPKDDRVNLVTIDEDKLKDEPVDPKNSIKEEKEGTERSSDQQESGAVDAMLLLHGSSSETEGAAAPGQSSTSSGSNGRDNAGLLASHSQGSVMCRWGMSGLGPPSSSLEALLDHPLSSPTTSVSPPLFMMGGNQPSSAPPASGHPSHFFFAAAAAAAAAAGGFSSPACGGIPPFFMPYGSWQNQFRRMSPNMLLAIDAVRSGRMGFTQAGKTFGVNGRTLWVYYRKLGYEVHNTFRGKRNKATVPKTEQKVNINLHPYHGASVTVQPVRKKMVAVHENSVHRGQPPSSAVTGDGLIMPAVAMRCNSLLDAVPEHLNPAAMSYEDKAASKSCPPPNQIYPMGDKMAPAACIQPTMPPPSPSEILAEITPSISLTSNPLQDPIVATDPTIREQPPGSFAKQELNYPHFNASAVPNPSQCRYGGANNILAPYSNQSNFMNCLYSMPTSNSAAAAPCPGMNSFERDVMSAPVGMTGSNHFMPGENEPAAVIDGEDSGSIESILESCNFRNMWSASL